MNAGITETDLLDLIEGRLPVERVDAVRTALRADPALRARVQAMVEDRRRLAKAGEGVRAPSGLAADAIAAAERDALVDFEPGAAAGRRRPKLVPLLAAACVGLLIVGGWSLFLIWSLNRPDTRSVTLPRMGIASEDEEAQSEEERTGEAVATASDDGLVGPLPPGAAPSAPPGPQEPQLTELAEDGEDALLKEWLEGLGRVGAIEEELAAEAGRVQEVPGVGLDRAVELLRAGRLKVVIESAADAEEVRTALTTLALGAEEGDRWAGLDLAPAPATAVGWPSRDSASPLPAGADPVTTEPERPDAGAPEAGTRPVRAVLDTGLTGDAPAERLAAMILGVIDDLRASGAGTLRLEEVPPRAFDPSRSDTDDILWWTQPVEEWGEERPERLMLPIEARTAPADG